MQYNVLLDTNEISRCIISVKSIVIMAISGFFIVVGSAFARTASAAWDKHNIEGVMKFMTKELL